MSNVSLYKKVINSDLQFLSTYSSYIPIIEEVMDKIDGTCFSGDFSSIKIANSTMSILENSKEFYLSLPGNYPNLFTQYHNNPRNQFLFKRLKDDEVPFGETTPIYGTCYSTILAGYNHSFDDYTTAIHEYGHGITNILNPNQFFDIEKYCIVETDGLFFELLGNDFTAKRFGYSKESINSSFESLSDQLLDAEVIYSKIQMYYHTDFKWKRSNIEDYLRSMGYGEDGIQYFMNRYLKDCFHYYISYLNAIELYMIYRQDPNSTLDMIQKIAKKSGCSAKDYLDYIRDLGIHPGEQLHSYFDLLIARDQEVGYGKRLQYKTK